MKVISESEVFDMPVGNYQLDNGNSVSITETKRYGPMNMDNYTNSVRNKVITFYKGTSNVIYRKKGPAVIYMNVKG